MFRAAIVGSLLCAITHCAEPNMAHAVKVEGVEVELRRPSQRDSKDVVKTAGEDEPKKSKKKSWWKTLTRTKRSSESSLLNSKRSPGKSDGRNAHSEGSHVFRVIGTWGDESFMESKRRSSFSNLANRWSHGDTLPRRSSGSKGDSLLKSIFQKKKKTAGVTDLDLSASFGMWPTDSKDTPSSPISPGTLSTDEFFGKALDAYKLAPVTNGSSATHSNPSPASKPADPVEDVFCNYAVMHPDALCLYKQRGSDTFTDIFHHNFMTKETKTCPTFTFTPPELSGKDFGRKEISRAWKNALAHVKKARWQDTAVQTDLMKFSHVIIGTCDIAFPKDLKTDISALVVQPEHKGKLTLAFFTEPEQPQVGVEFTMVEPERHSKPAWSPGQR
ncbi:hypothetical protein FOL47_002611 [Perkinsus chesapeaki]|uniref:Uncharacterized protein n=1 Tax=Perkinsus chesapeaki TaxID=330153 RepID=A0A7J6MD32_PERCH|nr:hypothetical protein FOL47_002611 [Perkinsus chesapeaki]